MYRLPFLPLIRRRGYAPVGRLGVEPSDTCVSGRPRRPAGSRPLSGWRRSRPPALARPSGFKPEAATRQLHHPRRRAEVTISSDCSPSRVRIGASSPAGSLSMSALPPDANGREMAEDGAHDAQRLPAPIRFPSAAGAPTGSSSKSASTVPTWCHGHRGRRRNRTARERPCSEEGGLLESHGVTRASASNGARLACPVHLPQGSERGHANRAVRADRGGGDSPASPCAPGGSRTRTPEDTGSWDRRGYQLRHQRINAREGESDRPDSNRPPNVGNVRCLPLTPRSHGADDGIRTRPASLGSWRAATGHHVRMEPARRIELRLRPYQRRVLPLPLGRRGVPGAGLEPAGSAIQKSRRECHHPTPDRTGAPGRSRTGCLPLTRRPLWPGELQRHKSGST
jgi:hypothetical protein